MGRAVKIGPKPKTPKVTYLRKGGLVARGCGAILPNRRKVTTGSVSTV
jgi:hypothetical protein